MGSKDRRWLLSLDEPSFPSKVKGHQDMTELVPGFLTAVMSQREPRDSDSPSWAQGETTPLRSQRSHLLQPSKVLLGWLKQAAGRLVGPSFSSGVVTALQRYFNPAVLIPRER